MLLKKYPETIAGMKDSSGDWNNTRTMLDNFAADGFDVFTGSETFLLENMRNGGVGCISQQPTSTLVQSSNSATAGDSRTLNNNNN